MKNIGKSDRIVRVLIAVLFTVLFLNQVVTGVMGIILVILAGVFLLTSVIGTCPLYLPFKINTNHKK
jgi:O-antigen/teichoic acid export membrane protein